MSSRLRKRSEDLDVMSNDGGKLIYGIDKLRSAVKCVEGEHGNVAMFCFLFCRCAPLHMLQVSLR